MAKVFTYAVNELPIRTLGAVPDTSVKVQPSIAVYGEAIVVYELTPWAGVAKL